MGKRYKSPTNGEPEMCISDSRSGHLTPNNAMDNLSLANAKVFGSRLHLDARLRSGSLVIYLCDITS